MEIAGGNFAERHVGNGPCCPLINIPVSLALISSVAASPRMFWVIVKSVFPPAHRWPAGMVPTLWSVPLAEAD